VIAEYHERARAAFAESACFAVLCGIELSVARAQVGHGDWDAWLKAHFVFDRCTAWRYMQAAQRKCAQLLTSNVAHVQHLAAGASVSSLPEPDREAMYRAVRDATNGETVRQLYLDLGLISKPEGPRAGGRPGPRTRRAIEEGKFLSDADLERMQAGQASIEIIRALRSFFGKKRHVFLSPREADGLRAELKSALATLQEVRHDG
jgi:hypothetical protein